MARFIITTITLCLITSPIFAQELCGENAPEANAAIERARIEMDGGDSAQAVGEAKRALELAETCFDAHLALTQAYNDRFDDVQGIAALPISRAFRAVLSDTLALRPDNVEARMIQIAYLHAAPKLAGGSRTQAEKLIEELAVLDAAAANKARMDIARNEGDNDTLIELLRDHPVRSQEELQERMQIARSLIIESQNYAAADAEILSWDNIELTEHNQVERLLLRGVLRVLGEYEYVESEILLTEFVRRREDLPAGAMEPTSTGQAYLGDALRLQGKAELARQAYQAALAQTPDNDRATKGLEALN